MPYLIFRRDKTLKEVIVYHVTNKRDDDLGFIKRARVGKFLHWKWFSPVLLRGEMSMTTGCLRELTTFISSLYSVHKEQKSTMFIKEN